MRYFGNFNLELRYCGILQTCGMRFLDVLVDDSWYENVSFTFFRPFLAVSGRFGSNLKRPCVLTTSLSLVTVSTIPPLVIASIFALGSTNPPAIQAYYEIAVFSEFFCGIAIFVEFFCGNAVFSNPQCPPLRWLFYSKQLFSVCIFDFQFGLCHVALQ